MAKALLKNNDGQFKSSLTQLEKQGGTRQVGLLSDVATELAEGNEKFAAFNDRMSEAMYCLTNGNPADITVISTQIENNITLAEQALNGWYSESTARRLYENYLRVGCNGKSEALLSLPSALFSNGFYAAGSFNKATSVLRIFLEILMLKVSEDGSSLNISYQNITPESYDTLLALFERVKKKSKTKYDETVLSSAMSIFEKPLWKYYSLDTDWFNTLGSLFYAVFKILYGESNVMQRDSLIELVLEQTAILRYKEAKARYILGTNITVGSSLCVRRILIECCSLNNFMILVVKWRIF
jgi:hypothetical protein